jgi:hypothetical protein
MIFQDGLVNYLEVGERCEVDDIVVALLCMLNALESLKQIRTRQGCSRE